jgi:hypothetical protein
MGKEKYSDAIAFVNLFRGSICQMVPQLMFGMVHSPVASP